MYNNTHMGQLYGPFDAKQELMIDVRGNAKLDVDYISHIGVSALPGTRFYLNYNLFEVGDSGMFELHNVKITSIYFLSQTEPNTIIDYIIEPIE